MRRLLAAGALALACLAPVPAVASAAAGTGAPRDAIADCTPSAGVLVAVDFGHWGGAVARGCDSTPTTGYDALHTAGFTTQGDQRDGPAFVCRINGLPSAADDPCVKTPPSSASWSYWHADAGQSTWSYSPTGATSSHPGAGSIDAWTFGGGTAPTFTPAQVRAGSAAPGPPATTPTSSAPSSPAPSSAAPTGAGSSTGPAGATTTATTIPRRPTAAHTSATTTTRPTTTKAAGGASTAPGTSTSSATASTGPAFVSASGRSSAPPSAAASPAAATGPSTSSASAPTIIDEASTPATHSSSGSAAPAIIGIAVALLLGAVTFVAVRRRRSG